MGRTYKMLIILAFRPLEIAFTVRQDGAAWEPGISMLSVIIATRDSERALVGTLCALVPGATMGLVREAIVADAGSRDETEQVADLAGCRFLASPGALGAQLKAAAESARGTWLMLLTAGVVPGPSWIDETIAFVEETERRGTSRAAVFASSGRSLTSMLGSTLGFLPSPRQGLIIAKAFYEELGGHPDIDAETALLRRIGRRRLVTLRTEAAQTDI